MAGVKGALGTTEGDPDSTLPEKCLIRFIDFTVEPGLVYEYKVAVEMANPLYQRGKLAVTMAMTREKTLVGPAAQVRVAVPGAEDQTQTTPDILVPTDRQFYAVDERSPHSIPADNERAAVQIQRWVDMLRTNPKDKDTLYPIGEWVVLKRLLVQRGEYIGRTEVVQVPAWSEEEGRFVFLKPSTKRRTRQKGVPVPFDTQTILVDFEGGRHRFADGQKTLTDEGPIEMLCLTDSGELLVHNGLTDLQDQTRLDHLQDWQDHVNAAKAGPMPGRGMNQPGGGLFGPAGGGTTPRRP
jgi:hypothetical protein